MIDRNIEQQIRKVKEIIQLWGKFHEIYHGAMSQTNIPAEEEQAFLNLKSNITRQYQGFLESLGLTYSSEDKTFEVISSILSLASLSSLTDMQFKKIENDWHSSYLNLNRILGSLENKREQLGKINTANLALKKIFSSYIVSLICIVLFIILAYIILVQTFHIDEFIKESFKLNPSKP